MGCSAHRGRLMTERDIQLALSYRHVGRSELVVPNVWMIWGECDLLAVSLSGYLTEYEIKVSLPDLKREWEKARWVTSTHFNEAHKSFSESVKNYWIAVPDYMAEKASPLIPEHSGAGLISVSSEPHKHEGAFRGVRPLLAIRKPRVNRKAKKITSDEWIALGRKGVVKYWNMVRKNA